jgi:hypothetical protein
VDGGLTVASEDRRWKVGRRGAGLLTFGVLYIVAGLGPFTAGTVGIEGHRALGLALAIAPIRVWGALLIAVGVLACLTACWPPGKDGWGFLALSMTGAWWTVVYICGGLFFESRTAWNQALVWAVVVTLILIHTGWEESGSGDPAIPPRDLP